MYEQHLFYNKNFNIAVRIDCNCIEDIEGGNDFDTIYWTQTPSLENSADYILSGLQ